MDNFKEALAACLEVAKKGGVFIYPTDTAWALGCDATNGDAVSKIHQLKNTLGQPLVCLVSNQAMLERYLEHIPEVAYDIMDLATKPVTIIFDQPKGFAKNILAQDGSIGLRVTKDKFTAYLINAFKKPLVATRVPLKKTPFPNKDAGMDPQILVSVDYVVNLQLQHNYAVAPSIIKLGNDGTVRVIRA